MNNQTNFGWDYPPGVSERMIPGNSPQDIQYEQAFEESFELLDVAKECVEEFITSGFGESFEFVLKEWLKARELSLKRCKCLCHVNDPCLERCK